MNGRDMMPACARIAAADPAMADRMWNTTTDDDGRDLVDERMRGKGRVLCAACPMRLDCISRALVNGWKDKAVYGGLDYASRWTLARLIARDLHIADGGLHRIPRSRVRDWLAEHPDWAERMRRDGRDYWRPGQTPPTLAPRIRDRRSAVPSDRTRAEGLGPGQPLLTASRRDPRGTRHKPKYRKTN